MTTTDSVTLAAGNINDAEAFRDTEIAGELRMRSIRSGQIVMLAQVISLLLSIASTSVLARLLMPEHYGLVGMATALLGIVNVFKDAGLGTATVQAQTISRRQMDTLFWINVGLGMVISVVVVCLSPFIIAFYHEPRIWRIVLVLASTFLLDGLVVQHQALLQRRLEFGWLSIGGVIAQGVATVMAIIMAHYGAGVWALVTVQVVPKIVFLPIVWLAAGWWPRLPHRNSGVRQFIGFGGGVSGFNFVNYFARNLDNILIGHYLGAVLLGIYSRSYLLFMMPLQQLSYTFNGIVLPGLSRLQDDAPRYRRYYLKVLLILVLLAFPLTGFLLICTVDVVRLVLGKGWEEVVPVFRLLALSLPLQVPISTTGWLLISRRLTTRLLRTGTIASLLIAFSFCLGLPFGIRGVSFAYSLCIALICLPLLQVSMRGTDIRLRDVIRTCAVPAVAAIVASLSAFASQFVWSPAFLIGRLALFCSVELAVYCLLLAIFSNVRNEILSLCSAGLTWQRS